MTTNQLLNVFQIEDILDLPVKITEILEGDIIQRNKIYLQLIEANNYDLSHDFFQESYEEELAQRSKGKQDFTPNVIGLLLSNLTGFIEGKIYEPTAGNGSLIVSNWNYRKNNTFYNPNEHPVECWELSDRSIPILLLNLSIRGIVGNVYHGDVLTKRIKCQYNLSSTNNNDFSIIQKI